MGADFVEEKFLRLSFQVDGGQLVVYANTDPVEGETVMENGSVKTYSDKIVVSGVVEITTRRVVENVSKKNIDLLTQVLGKRVSLSRWMLPTITYYGYVDSVTRKKVVVEANNYSIVKCLI